MKTKTRSCCGIETFAFEEEAQRRFDKIHRLNLAGTEKPTRIKQCYNGGWHLVYPEQSNEPSPKVRAMVEARDGNRCVRCGKPCSRAEDSLHHRWPRGRGGENTVENLIVLCGDGVTLCHGFVEKNRTAAYKLGYLVETGINPADKPVAVAGVGWRWPTSDGRWITAEEYGAPIPAEVTQ